MNTLSGMMKLYALTITSFVIMLVSCAAPRAVLDGPQVAPKWKAEGRVEVGASIPTVTLGKAATHFDLVKDWAESIVDSSTVEVPDSTYVRNLSELIVAYATDPLGPTGEIVVGIGLPLETEFVYRKLAGGNSFGLRYQFMKSEMLGALGAAYSSQDYTLPSFLGNAQDLLGFAFKRVDYTFPVVVGKTFGKPEGFRGEWGLGIQYQLSKVSYEFEDPSRQLLAAWLIEGTTGDPTAAEKFFQSVPQANVTTHSFGGQGNFRVGYKFVNLVLGLGMYYQVAGDYVLLDGSKYSPDGLTILPKVGLEFRGF